MLGFLKRLVSKDKTPDQHTRLLPATTKLSASSMATNYQTLVSNNSAYSADLELYLEECKAAPLSASAVAQLPNREFLCNLSFLIPLTPVRLNGEIYDLKALEGLPDFNNDKGFHDPLNRKDNKRYLKKDLVPARDVREKIVRAVNDASLVAQLKSRKPVQASDINSSYQLFQYEEPAPAVKPAAGGEKSNLLGFKTSYS